MIVNSDIQEGVTLFLVVTRNHPQLVGICLATSLGSERSTWFWRYSKRLVHPKDDFIVCDGPPMGCVKG
ncbi:hypothetical protein EYZ11_007495 [Aspergillus tanneri]|uniref:Uncharacterized protein n=1 Tax=Aspergillus tanneri TaxID=1220188 RepID=A0A4S3JCU3_9EURO|nr:hypothetical protein EYZ11_007495 [Aspergillus tanneri]